MTTRTEALREAADLIEQAQATNEAKERDRHGFLDHETELQGGAVRDMAAYLRRIADEAEGKSSRQADATPDRNYPPERLGQYITALNDADTYAQLSTPADRERLARAVMAIADAETDPVYRSGYATGREHAGAAGWLLQHFTPVFTTSDGTDVPAKELRCGTCNAVTRNTRPMTLLDHSAAAAQHECLSNPDAITRKDGRS